MGPTIRVAVMARHRIFRSWTDTSKIYPINTAPIHTGLCLDTPTQTEPRFIIEECKFWVKNTVITCLQKRVIKIRSVVIALFKYLNFCCSVRPWLAHHSVQRISCPRKTQSNPLFCSPIWKSLMKVEFEHQDNYDETLFYTIYRISFSHNCRTETRNRFLNYLTRRETQNWELTLSVSCTCNIAVRNIQIPVFHAVRLARKALLAPASKFSSGSGKIDFLVRRTLCTDFNLWCPIAHYVIQWVSGAMYATWVGRFLPFID
jgi:hypothetical protein